ncbi:helix-turn-helix domain-containing protein [Pseudomonas sp. A1437]|jgi:transcriptional regulator with XRE-family HTH domain|uniref:helix-turn-helix domain-containing protein n=1 Tax=Pseudomonas TaxID=286 RepID=UPI00190A2BCB|nr:helix-turn-helix domain-containing protein [Pseudomonas rhodesiae]MBK3483438.1 helix-turn-helix domain-containing protein [Pseudomonas fluorescens]MDN6865047.1 helix-turn-helix domain-containing protein [Pseudomonas rhodesiae]
MPLRESLAAVIRLLRISRGLSKDDFQGVVDPKHVFNLENARSGVTLDTLELLASVLKIDPLTLLTVAASLNRGISHEDLLHQLREQGEQLTRLGVSEKWSGEFRDGALRPVEAGRRTPPKKVEAILACRARGMTQKATAEEQGISRATVSRIWQRQSE